MEEMIKLAHGAGGKQTSELIGQVFKKNFDNPYFTPDDAAILTVTGDRIAMTTDGFIVSPYRFPGGNIGKLSVCGTVNDLACMGAKPKYMTCGFVIEEGFPMKDLQEITDLMAATAKEAGVVFVAGDTKVAGKGQVDKVFITTTGIGEVMPDVNLSGKNAKPGDVILVTGDVGRHGCTILLEREDLGIHADITSDCAPLWGTVKAMLDCTKDIHVIRDATRGGVGTVLYEIAAESDCGVRIDRDSIPVHSAVEGVCDMLGLDPLYLANEGTMVVIAPKDKAEDLLRVLHGCPYSANAAVIGEITEDNKGRVIAVNTLGVPTMLPQPSGELLPRIC